MGDGSWVWPPSKPFFIGHLGNPLLPASPTFLLCLLPTFQDIPAKIPTGVCPRFLQNHGFLHLLLRTCSDSECTWSSGLYPVCGAIKHCQYIHFQSWRWNAPAGLVKIPAEKNPRLEIPGESNRTGCSRVVFLGVGTFDIQTGFSSVLCTENPGEGKLCHGLEYRHGFWVCSGDDCCSLWLLVGPTDSVSLFAFGSCFKDLKLCHYSMFR